MSKELKTIANAINESPLAVTVKESAEQVWLAGLGAYGVAQEEGSKLFSSLVKEGEIVQARTRKMADAKLAEVTKTAVRALDRFEKVWDEGIARSLHSLGVPTRKDINRLSDNVAALTAVVQEWVEEHAEEQAEEQAQ